jgi:hypothetical protein
VKGVSTGFFDSKWDFEKIILITFSLVFILLSAFLIYQTNQKNILVRDFEAKYSDLAEKYETSINASSVLRGYYNELQGSYDILLMNFGDLQDYYEDLQGDMENLQNNYLELESLYGSLLLEKEILELELGNIKDFKKSMVLEENRTLVLYAKDNRTLSYEVPYAGFLELNFTSSMDMVLWVGSSFIDGLYYARIPPTFPDTSNGGSFTVPALSTVYVYLYNPNEFLETEVVLDIHFFY